MAQHVGKRLNYTVNGYDGAEAASVPGEIPCIKCRKMFKSKDVKRIRKCGECKFKESTQPPLSKLACNFPIHVHTRYDHDADDQ